MTGTVTRVAASDLEVLFTQGAGADCTDADLLERFVLDRDGHPLSNVELALDYVSLHPAGRTRGQAIAVHPARIATDAEGRFQFDAIAGIPISLDLGFPYRSLGQEIIVKSGEKRDLGDLVADKTQ